MEVYLLYGILLAGSPTFGLEALLLGSGGKLSLIHGEKRKLAATSLPIGLTLVGISIVLTHTFSLPPLYLCILPLGLAYLAGKIIGIQTKETSRKGEIPIQEKTTDLEIKNMLKKRGLEGLAKDNKEEN
ncbi:hypothetical protein AKJ64_03840 [candidate division MSBL1 archaeon SCGC-AAA259E17]|uniref:Uncharacterized protein n=1 Tax=candidate division MSBL1 archaeon SCGC-AAA259E17 TaxID=1698263 RepID=A0A133UDB1_9EURY|nr:hypothetical protein AKJ64_03840 [candidate division MSBL1 archaeon SCGC-AAA259E17]